MNHVIFNILRGVYTIYIVRIKRYWELIEMLLPAHCSLAHTLVSVLEPAQLEPPYEGTGESHALTLTCTPPPQDFEQRENGPYALHPPSTRMNKVHPFAHSYNFSVIQIRMDEKEWGRIRRPLHETRHDSCLHETHTSMKICRVYMTLDTKCSSLHSRYDVKYKWPHCNLIWRHILR